MTASKRRPRSVVLEHTKDENGTVWRAVELNADGELSVVGHDVGRGVTSLLGGSSYEFARKLSIDETATLRGLLDVASDGDLLAAIGERFEKSSELEAFLKEHDITGDFWSWIDD